MKKRAFWTCLLILFCNTASAADHFDINDGGHHIIDYNTEDITGMPFMRVDYETPGVGTTVDVIENGWIRGLSSYHDSVLNFYGGEVYQTFYAYQSSAITVSDGLINALIADHHSTVHHQGGEIQFLRTGEISSSCQVVIENSAQVGNLQVQGDSKATIYDGMIGNIGAYDLSIIDVKGGLFSGTITSGIIGNSILDESLIRIAGSNFSVNGTPVGPGQYLSDYAVEGLDPHLFPCLTGTVTGVLADGNIIDATFYISDSADIMIIPEPATLVLLGIGGFLIRKRK